MAIPVQAPIQPVDLMYLERVAARAIRLERIEIGVRQDSKHTEEQISRLKQDLAMEMKNLEEEMTLASKEVDMVVTRLKNTLTQFKDVAKKQDVARLQARVDQWAPHDKISRSQFKKMLDDNCSS